MRNTAVRGVKLLRHAARLLALSFAFRFCTWLAIGRHGPVMDMSKTAPWADDITAWMAAPAIASVFVFTVWNLAGAWRDQRELTEERRGQVREAVRNAEFARRLSEAVNSNSGWWAPAGLSGGTIRWSYQEAPGADGPWHYHPAADEPITDGVCRGSDIITACDVAGCARDHLRDCWCFQCKLRRYWAQHGDTR